MGCGPYDFSFSGYSFLNPEIADREAEFAPYILDFEDFYQQFEQPGQKQTQTNLEEWQGRFCDLVTIDELRAVIYNASLPSLRVLQTAIKRKGKTLDNQWSKNGFAKHLKKHGCKETIDYLVFAKRCEPHVTKPSNSWATPARDTLAMKDLIEEGKKTFLKTKSHYIKLRYAYQLIRLAHYTKNYHATIELHDYLMPKVDKLESILNYWIMGHRAGALQKLGNFTESAYLYALIYKNCPGKRLTAKQSFKINTDEEWDACLLYCNDDSERAMLYVLRAQTQDSKAAEEMAKIYELNPDDPNLELLLVREMKKLEKDLLGYSFNNKKEQNKRFHKIPRQHAEEYLIQLQKLVRKIVRDRKVSRLVIWEIAEAYLELLAGDNYAARKNFAKIQLGRKQELLAEQLEVFKLALEINSFYELNQTQEERVFDIIKNEDLYKEYKDFPNFINDRLAALYKEQDKPGRAFRMHYDVMDLAPNPQLALLDDLIALANQEELNKFQRLLVSDADGNAVINDLYDMKGTYYFRQGNLEAALETFKLIPRDQRDNHQLNPFLRDEILDCVFCPQPDSIELFNKVEIIEKIFALEYQAKASMVSGAQNFYELGLAYFNMSFYGNSWRATDFFRSGSNWDYAKNDLYPSVFPYGNKENHDLSQAMFYFNRAIEVSKDSELSARAAFMAAKCDLLDYLNSKDSNYNPFGNRIPALPDAYKQFYYLLDSDYSETEFYKEAIQECKFFAAYSSN